jgi:hypothetical protein
MKFFDYYFCAFFNFLGSFESKLESHTIQRRAVMCVFMISMLLSINILSIYPSKLDRFIVYIFVSFSGIIFFVYFYKKRYLEVIKKFKESLLGNVIIALYILSSIILLWIVY